VSANRAPSLAFAILALAIAVGGRASGGENLATPAASTECEAARSAYTSAIAQALTCDPAKSDSCSASRPAALEDVCRCVIAVNPAATARLDELAAEYQSKGCVNPGICRRLCKQPAASCSGVPATCR
jgi:hypothetical protein